MNKTLLLICLPLAPSITLADQAQRASRPNIVIILADDMGYGDCMVNNPESKIPTPHIDQLAREGLRFTDAHSASATCTASRYGLLTGINPARTGVTNVLLNKGKPVIEKGETTIAELLKDHGYITKMVGKWHIGFEMNMEGRRPAFDFSRPLIGGPLDCGFDDFYGTHSSPNAPPFFYIHGRRPVEKPTGTTVGRTGTEKDRRWTWASGPIAPGFVHLEISPNLCSKAVEIIHRYADSGEKEPLFLYYAMSAPHAPWLPIKEFVGKSKAGRYGDFNVQLDAEVGRVVRALKETGLNKNTLLIFTSDNGPPWSDQDIEEFDHKAAGIFRGHKGTSYEGGHRVPFTAKWPGKIPASTVSQTTINFTDVFATLAELLKVDFDQAYPGSAKDSHSFLPVLFDPTKRLARPAMVITPYSIRMEDWKLLAPKRGKKPEDYEPSDFVLFDLEHDPSETTDLADSNPEQRDRLFREYKEFIASRTLK